MGQLEKTVTVLDRVRGRAYAQPFDPLAREHLLFLDEDVYRDFGEPEQITVTIEPGDKLNE